MIEDVQTVSSSHRQPPGGLTPTWNRLVSAHTRDKARSRTNMRRVAIPEEPFIYVRETKHVTGNPWIGGSPKWEAENGGWVISRTPVGDLNQWFR